MSRRASRLRNARPLGLRQLVRACCWLLLLHVAWQGPIPALHLHGTLANSPLSSAWRLATHLQTHHPGCSPCENAFFGWHFHIQLPTSSPDAPQQPLDADQQRLPSADVADGFLRLIAQSARTGTGTTLPVALLDCGGVVPSQAISAAHSRTHFFDTFAPALPLPLRFGILRT